MAVKKAAVAGFAGGSVGGCSPGPKPNELQFWTIQLSPKFDPLIRSMLSEWEEQNPGVSVRWTDLPFGSVERKLLAAVFARTAPDVVNLNPCFRPISPAKVDCCRCSNGSPLRSKRPICPGCSRPPSKTVSSTLPWYLTARITLANQSLLKAAGYSQPPATWAEVPAYAEAVKSARAATPCL